MKDPTTPLSRRSVFAGAGTLGALAAAATVLPGVTKPDTAPAPGKPTAEPPQTGYRLTEHIERYYRTTRV
jgi:hypothetical protein